MKTKPIALLIAAAFSANVYADIQFDDSELNALSQSTISESNYHAAESLLSGNLAIYDSISAANSKHSYNNKSKKSANKSQKNKLVASKQQVGATNSSINSFVIEDIQSSGMNHVDGKFLLKLIQLNKGMQLSESDIPNIEQKILSTGLFQSVRIEKRANNLVLHVVENPSIKKIQLDGNKTLRKHDVLSIMNQLHIVENSAFSPVLLKEFEKGLKQHYAEKGRYSAEISTISELQEDGYHIKVNIIENESTKLNQIKFVGNKDISSNKLQQLMKLESKGWRNLLTDRVDQTQLRADLERIVDYYHENGYFDAGTNDVKFIDVSKNAGKPMQDIEIHLTEGNKFTFAQPKINVPQNLYEDMKSNEKSVLNNAALEKLIVIKAGDPYKKSKVIDSSQNIKMALANHGFAFAKVEIVPEKLNDNTIRFVFDITTGSNKPVKINDYKISFFDSNGQKTTESKTKEHVIKREMRQKTNDVYSLEKMQRSKERLDLTGYFSQVNMETESVADNSDLVDININVVERKTGSVQVSAGYMQDYGPTFGVNISDRNLKGSGQGLSAGVNYNKTQQNASISYDNPFFIPYKDNAISLNTTAYGSIYDPRKQKDNFQTYKTQKTGVNFNFGFPIGEYDRIYSGLNLEHMKLNTYDDAPLKYRQFIQEYGNTNNNASGVGSFKGWLPKFTLGYGRNTSNHAYFPTKGYMVNVNGEITIPSVSKLDYYKAETSGKVFAPLGKNGAALMLSGRAGYANSYSSTKELPFFENYYGGGLGFVRGFENGSLGPKVEDKNSGVITYGGNKMVGLSLEAQAPLPQFLVKDSSNVRVSAFVDAGSIWDGKNYTALDSDTGRSVYSKDIHKSSFKNEFRASTGLAWTWLSPMGAVKLSYAYPIKKKQEDQIQKFQFQLGTTF